MADREIREVDGEPDLNLEDPELTPQNRWRWLFPVGVLVALPALGIYALGETSGTAFWPSHNALMRNSAPERAVGTSGQTPAVARSSDESTGAVIRDVETITGINDRHPLVGRRVDLRAPIAARANDQAFWIGSKDNLVLVVPRRDRRDSQMRQQGQVANTGLPMLESGKMVSISGSIERLPRAEERYSWGLTSADLAAAAAVGVYVHADVVSEQ
jgi:hypothetical protein